MSLCECGCGEPAPIAKKTYSARGVVKGQVLTFIQGHHSRMPEYRARMLAGQRPAGQRIPLSPEARNKIRTSKLGERNPMWKGDEASAGSLHEWLIVNYPKTGVCESCGAEGPTDHAFDHRLGRYTRNREDYSELCRSCHTAWDVEMGQRPTWLERAS